MSISSDGEDLKSGDTGTRRAKQELCLLCRPLCLHSFSLPKVATPTRAKSQSDAVALSGESSDLDDYAMTSDKKQHKEIM